MTRENTAPLPGAMPGRLPEGARPPADFDPVGLAKTLLRATRAGTLGTLDRNTGHPFASLVNVATDLDGSPVILTSRLSTHTGWPAVAVRIVPVSTLRPPVESACGSVARTRSPTRTSRIAFVLPSAISTGVDRRETGSAGGTFARAMRVGVAIALAGLALAGCGSERQDANEPEGEFTLEVVDASFPARQTTAQQATMRLSVRNTDDRDLPNLAVTIATEGADGGDPAGAFAVAEADPRLADDSKPVWIVDRGPAGGDTAATNTWALGPLTPGQTREFEWRVTAVRPGTYTVNYRVSPGLNGKAVPANGQRTTGSFEVEISDEPVPARVNRKGEVVRGEESGD